MSLIEVFRCRHCSHRLDLHTASQVRVGEGQVDELVPVLLRHREILTCYQPGCDCRYAPLESPGHRELPSASMFFDYLSTAITGVPMNGHLDLERWEAEMTDV